MPTEKKLFLVAYDYGPGGLWGAMLAGSKEEIKAVYPELHIVDERPAWMSKERYDEIWTGEPYDVDGAASGMLSALLADRQR